MKERAFHLHRKTVAYSGGSRPEADGVRERAPAAKSHDS